MALKCSTSNPHFEDGEGPKFPSREFGRRMAAGVCHMMPGSFAAVDQRMLSVVKRSARLVRRPHVGLAVTVFPGLLVVTRGFLMLPGSYDVTFCPADDCRRSDGGFDGLGQSLGGPFRKARQGTSIVLGVEVAGLLPCSRVRIAWP